MLAGLHAHPVVPYEQYAFWLYAHNQDMVHELGHGQPLKAEADLARGLREGRPRLKWHCDAVVEQVGVFTWPLAAVCVSWL